VSTRQRCSCGVGVWLLQVFRQVPGDLGRPIERPDNQCGGGGLQCGESASCSDVTPVAARTRAFQRYTSLLSMFQLSACAQLGTSGGRCMRGEVAVLRPGLVAVCRVPACMHTSVRVWVPEMLAVLRLLLLRTLCAGCSVDRHCLHRSSPLSCQKRALRRLEEQQGEGSRSTASSSRGSRSWRAQACSSCRQWQRQQPMMGPACRGQGVHGEGHFRSAL